MSEPIFIKDGVAYHTDEAIMIPEFHDLYEWDKSKDKRKYYDVLFYIYFVYKFDGIYKTLYPAERKNYVRKTLLEDRLSADIEQQPLVIRLIQKYQYITMSFIKRDYEQTKFDIESLNKHISTIPFVKKVQLKNHTANFEYKGQIINTTVDITVEMDNSKEKADALKLKDTLYDLEERLRSKSIKEDSISEDDTSSLIEDMQS